MTDPAEMTVECRALLKAMKPGKCYSTVALSRLTGLGTPMALHRLWWLRDQGKVLGEASVRTMRIEWRLPE